MQTRAFLKLDKKYCVILLRAKHLPVKGLIDIRCHALEAAPKRPAIHKLNTSLFLQKIKSECKYLIINGNKQVLMIINELFERPVGDYCIACNTIKSLLNLLSMYSFHFCMYESKLILGIVDLYN